MYEELIKHLRHYGKQTGGHNVIICNGAADAIEELEKELNTIKHKVKSLQDSQHYSGRYIKSILGVKE